MVKPTGQEEDGVVDFGALIVIPALVEFHEQVKGASCLVGYAVLETGLDSAASLESNFWREIALVLDARSSTTCIYTYDCSD
jgi:hypothetical protein